MENVWTSTPAKVTRLTDGTAQIEIDFKGEGACMIFLGATAA